MSGTTALYDRFQLPTDTGYSFGTMSIQLPADFVVANDIPAAADHIDVPLDMKGMQDSTLIWQDRLSIPVYRESFTLGTDNATVALVTPDLRVHSITRGSFTINRDVPKMKGQYFIIVMGDGTYSFGPGVDFGPYDPPAPDRSELETDEPNASRATATQISYGQTFSGSVGPVDSWGVNHDPVDYLYFDIP